MSQFRKCNVLYNKNEFQYIHFLCFMYGKLYEFEEDFSIDIVFYIQIEIDMSSSIN